MKAVVQDDCHDKHKCTISNRNLADALYVLNGKWKFPLLFALRESSFRFNEILKDVEGISPKVLARELRELEVNGLVQRHESQATPGVVIYGATEYSETLKTILLDLCQWGSTHREKIKEINLSKDGSPIKNESRRR